MITSKTPLRVSFAGGGTDIADYYRTWYDAVVSPGIRKYVYVTVNKRFDDDIRISYAKTEIVDSVDKIEHGLVRERDTEVIKRLPTRNRVDQAPGDLSDADSIRCAIKESEPDEIRNVVAPAFVISSIRDFVMTRRVGVLGATRVMASAMEHAPDASVFQRRKDG